MDNALKYASIISKSLEKKSLTSINSVSMKYRYEGMKLSEIAYQMKPNIRKEQGNLFERLLYNKGSMNIDKDILISQKILQKLKRGSNNDYNEFRVSVINDKEDKGVNNSDRSITYRDNIVQHSINEENKDNSDNKVIRKLNININDNDYSCINKPNGTQLGVLKQRGHMTKDKVITTTKSKMKRTLCPLSIKNKVLKQSKSSKYIDTITPYYLNYLNPIRNPLSHLNKNSLKMRYNLSKEKTININYPDKQDLPQYNQLLNDDTNNAEVAKIKKIKPINSIITNRNQLNKKPMLRNVLLNYDPIESSIYNQINAEYSMKMKKSQSKSSSTTHHPNKSNSNNQSHSGGITNSNSSSLMLNHNKNAFIALKTKILNVNQSSIKSIKEKHIREMNHIKDINNRTVRNYYREIEMHNSKRMQYEAKRINEVHNKIFGLLTNFENEFSRRITKFSQSQLYEPGQGQ